MKLRIAHLVIQPVLVWDDGEELTPGPEIGTINIPLSRLNELIESLPGEVAGIQEKIQADN